jgi:hypothetical protein
MRLDAVENKVATVALSIVKGETVEVKDPRQRDAPWLLADHGDGDVIEERRFVAVGHKIRVGNHRQFRILSFDGTNAVIAVVGPEAEV